MQETASSGVWNENRDWSIEVEVSTDVIWTRLYAAKKRDGNERLIICLRIVPDEWNGRSDSRRKSIAWARKGISKW